MSSTGAGVMPAEDASALLRLLLSEHPALVEAARGKLAAATSTSVPTPSSASAAPPPPLARPPKGRTPGASAEAYNRSAAAAHAGLPAKVKDLLEAGARPPSERGFDMRKHRLRHVALHIAYIGEEYFGFASQERGGGDVPDAASDDGDAAVDGSASGAAPHPPSASTAAAASSAPGKKRPRADGGDGGGSGTGGATPTATATPSSSSSAPVAHFPTVESLLFAALRKTCLVEERAGSGYTRCGRTDRGVSAAGQVISLRLRSRARRVDIEGVPAFSDAGSCSAALADLGSTTAVAAAAAAAATAGAAGTSTSDAAAAAPSSSSSSPSPPPPEAPPSHPKFHRLWRRGDGLANSGEPFPPPEEELDYSMILNSLLPPDIRVLGWADVPEPFSARFSATMRTYRYYFPRRSLDIPAMRAAAGELVGEHDFRNICKIDLEHTQNFVREIVSVRIVRATDEEGSLGGASASASASAAGGVGYVGPDIAGAVGCTSAPSLLAPSSSSSSSSAAGPTPVGLLGRLAPALLPAVNAADAAADAPRPAAASPRDMFYIEVVGRAFLWHQIRCVAALLFLVGRGLETRATLRTLLDPSAVPARPQYTMAAEGPLILHHCGFGEEEEEGEGAGATMAVEEEGEGEGFGPAAAASLERRVRFLPSLPSLHLSWNASPGSLRKVTADLEKAWTTAAVRAAMLKGVLDRVYGAQTMMLGGGPGGAAKGKGGVPPPTPVRQPPQRWGAVVESYVASRTNSTNVAGYNPADADFSPTANGGGKGPGGGTYQPILARPTGKAVEDRWRDLSDERKAAIVAMHPVNAPRLDTKAKGKGAEGRGQNEEEEA
jgi:tRNA U38,U39,U40 pseudouridine synthase TruA